MLIIYYKKHDKGRSMLAFLKLNLNLFLFVFLFFFQFLCSPLFLSLSICIPVYATLWMDLKRFLEYRDFMEKFLDEQDNNGAGASSSLVHSLLSSDSKRRASPLPMMMQQAAAAAQAGEESSITADEVRILKNHVEDIARHLSPQEIESLVQLAVPTRVPNGMMPGGNGANMGSTGDGAVTPAISISRGLSTPDNKIHSLAQ